MKYTGFVISERPILVGEKEYTVRSCIPKLSTSEYEVKKNK